MTRQSAAQDDDEDIEWGEDNEDDVFTSVSWAKCNGDGVRDLAEDREQQHQDEEEDEPKERRVRVRSTCSTRVSCMAPKARR